MAKIAEALNVGQATITRDLFTVNKSTARGRPRKYTPEEETELGKLVFEDGIAMHEAQAIVRPSEPIRDWPTKATITAVERERGRREERTQHEERVVATAPACTCPNCGHQHTIGSAGCAARAGGPPLGRPPARE